MLLFIVTISNVCTELDCFSLSSLDLTVKIKLMFSSFSLSLCSLLLYQHLCLCLPEGEEVGFDTLESSSHKLVHLTASRAKGPKKRPPSTVLFPSVCMLHGSLLGTSPLTLPATSSALAFVASHPRPSVSVVLYARTVRVGASPLAVPDARVVCMFVLQRLKCQCHFLLSSLCLKKKHQKKACMLHTAKTRVEFFSGGGEQERRG